MSETESDATERVLDAEVPQGDPGDSADVDQLDVSPAEPEPEPEPLPAVVAQGLRLHGRRGVIYGPLDLHMEQGELVVFQGPQGSGRSSLLLTLAGRLKPDRRRGSLTVLGHTLPKERRAVQHEVAIAGFDGIDALESSVTVAASIRERMAWLSAWYRPTPLISEDEYRRIAAPVFGDREPPRLKSVVWDLDEVDTMLLRIMIALLQRPHMLVVDDLDQVRDAERRQIVWTALEGLRDQGLTVVAAVSSAREVASMRWRVPPPVVRLTTGPRLPQHAATDGE